MKKKRIIIAVVCLILAVLMVGSLFVAAGIAFSRIEDFQFGGLVGELLAGKDEILSDDATADTEADSPEELATDDSYTEDFTYEDVSDFIDPPVPGGDPTLRFFLGSSGAWIGNNQIQEFFETGKASEWDHRAVIEDYNAKYVHVWGWAAIFKETPLQLGYRIDDEPAVYGENVEIYEADQSSVTAALGMGALTANSMRIEIPVEKLSGTHTVQILVRNQGGDNEGVICTFEIEKPINPNAPVFLADATYLLQALRTQPSSGVTSYSYTPPILFWEEGDFVSLTTITTTFASGYFTILPDDDVTETTGARYLAIKYRRWFLDSITLYLGSGGNIGSYELPCTENDWQFVIIDLEELDLCISDTYDLSNLRFNFDAPNNGKEYGFEIAYVATFDSIEAAQAYNAEHPYAKG